MPKSEMASLPLMLVFAVLINGAYQQAAVPTKCKFNYMSNKFCEVEGFKRLPPTGDMSVQLSGGSSSGPKDLNSRRQQEEASDFTHFQLKPTSDAQVGFASPVLDVSSLNALEVTFDYVLFGRDVGSIYVVMDGKLATDSTDTFNQIKPINANALKNTQTRQEVFFKGGNTNINTWNYDFKKIFDVTNLVEAQITIQFLRLNVTRSIIDDLSIITIDTFQVAASTVLPSTTAPPTTVAPTTAAPTTAAPTTAAPTTAAPTTAAPTTADPTTAAPTTAAPTTAAPTTTAPTTAAPTTAAPTTAAPTTAAPTTAAPTTAVPTTAAPTTAVPTTAAPTTAAPTTAAPTTTVPTTAAPTTAAPTTAAPTTAAPTTAAPTTAAPTTAPPTTAPPTTAPPTTAAPTTTDASGWESWSEWSVCNVECGPGNQTRNRTCQSGQTCTGLSEETQPCVGASVLCNGQWGPWGTFSACSGTCGNRTRVSKRVCPNSGVPPCDGSDTKIEACVEGECFKELCDGYDGQYSCTFDESYNQNQDGFCQSNNFDGWASYGFMVHSGNTPSADTGPSNDHTFKKSCGSYIYYEASQQLYGVLASGTFMSTSGEMCLSFALSMYSKIKTDMGVLNIALLKEDLSFVKTLWNQDGAVSDTPEDWRTVSIPVDGLTPNMKYRIVFVATRMNENSDIAIDDFKLVEGNCTQEVDGQWASWGQWGQCDKECGESVRTRMRFCTEPAPSANGKQCPNQLTGWYQNEDCHLPACKVHGAWTNWFDWGECDKKCGNGTRIRVRECANPAPVNGGDHCLDLSDNVRKLSDTEDEPCNTHPCKKC